MGSSARKKAEKKKDFQVPTLMAPAAAGKRSPWAETKVQGRQGQAKGLEFHRYELQIQGWAHSATTRCNIPVY